MKKYFLYLIALSFCFSGCKTIDKLTQFNMEFNEEVTLPSSMGIGLPFDILTPEVPTNSEYAFSENDTRKDLIEEIILTELVLTIKSPDDSDFSFLKSIEVFINADGLEEQKIAWANDVPDNQGASIKLETSGTNLEEYIKKDQFKLKVSTVTDEAFTPDHVVNVYSKFFVDAKIAGL